MKEPQWLLRETVLALLLLREAEATVKTLALAARELDETG